MHSPDAPTPPNPLSRQSFYFIRHGQTDYNVADRVQGHLLEIPLNATGIRQCEDAARRLAAHPFELIITSPLLRARQTANIINQALNGGQGVPIIEHAGLLERHTGAWQGRLWHDILAEHGLTPESGEKPPFPPDAETYTQMDTRVYNALLECDRCHRQPFLLVAHGGVFRALSKTLRNLSVHSDNAVPYRFSYQPAGWSADPL